VNNVLRVFVGDMSFVNPACTGFTTKASVFGLNVGVAAGAIIVVCAVSGVRWWWRANSARRYFASAEDIAVAEEVRDVARASMLESWVMFMISVLVFTYEILIVKSVEGVSCFAQEGVLRLTSEPDQVQSKSYILMTVWRAWWCGSVVVLEWGLPLFVGISVL